MTYSDTCVVSLITVVVVVIIYEDLLRHGASYSVVTMELVETLETSSAAARRKAQDKRQVALEK